MSDLRFNFVKTNFKSILILDFVLIIQILKFKIVLFIDLTLQKLFNLIIKIKSYTLKILHRLDDIECQNVEYKCYIFLMGLNITFVNHEQKNNFSLT